MTSFTKTICAALVFAGLFATQSAQAQQIKIGYADAELVLVNMKEYKEIGAKVQQQAATSRQAIQTMADEFQADYEKFEKQAPLLPPEKQQERQAELEKRYQEIQTKTVQEDQTVAKLESDLLNPLLERVGEAVNAVAEEKGLDIVLRAPGLLYINPNTVTDITTDVARRLGIEVTAEG